MLVLTIDADFGGIVQTAFSRTSGYQITLTSSCIDAIQTAHQAAFELAVLDAELAGGRLLEIETALKQNSPHIHIVLLAAGDSGTTLSPLAEETLFYLSTPFDLHGFIEVVQRSLGNPERAQPDKRQPVVESNNASLQPAISAPLARVERGQGTMPAPILPALHQEEMLTVDTQPMPPWLKDVTRAAQHLARLSLSSAAQAALIVRDGQLWAYAGQLPQPAAQELSEVVMKYWLRDNSPQDQANSGVSDLARFVHLQSTATEYMLYATGLHPKMVLALAYDSETPFSKIRAQARELARALANPLGDEIQPRGIKASRNDTETTVKPAPRDTAVDAEERNLPDDEHQETKPLFDLEDVPPPTPDAVKNLIPDLGVMHWPWEQDDELAKGPLGESEPAFGVGFTAEPQAPQQEPIRTVKQSGAKRPDPQQEDEPTQLAPNPESSEHDFLYSQLDPAGLPRAVEAVHIPGAGETAFEIKPVSSSVYHLNYACVLVPRLPNHHLTGDISARLAIWMRWISISYGWRLEYLAVRPDYLQWVANVPPSISADQLLYLVRQNTSKHIFNEFPRLAEENPSGDFWAPGYLVMSSLQPLPGRVLQDYVAQTRRRQGISSIGQGD